MKHSKIRIPKLGLNAQQTVKNDDNSKDNVIICFFPNCSAIPALTNMTIASVPVDTESDKQAKADDAPNCLEKIGNSV